MKSNPTLFEDYKIRRLYDEATETWYFSVVDVIQALIQQPDFQAARNYWKVLKNRLNKEGSETVTNCNRLKMLAEDGKLRLTDAATAETLLRLIQSIPSPKAELIFTALAELSTRQIAETMEAVGMSENEVASREGGGIAKKARIALETKTGQKVVSADNFLERRKVPEKLSQDD
ncbi:MAG: hypothetical protein A3F18_07775 [Legionellales bacterium RIFCSPHIGHO2_12_FULL_37_14]|nr:MAG: hypothetical protein A3F18_07775 [Legionellales bacterium RIFCSPHIGHO2_12_FULL_37_14]